MEKTTTSCALSCRRPPCLCDISSRNNVVCFQPEREYHPGALLSSAFDFDSCTFIGTPSDLVW